MKDEDKSKEQLIDELVELRQQITELETECKQAEDALKEYSERLEEIVEQRTKELRDAQDELIRKERLVVLGQLAGGVSHELRNPPGVISKEVHNAEKIVSDLLNLSRTKPAEREEIAVSDLVARLLEGQPPPEKVKVTTKMASDLPPCSSIPYR